MKAIRERTETDPLEIDLREEGDNGPVLSGLGVPYGKWSEKLGWFREKIHEGAATKTLRESKDIALLYNHNSDKILARTSSGTLTLDERTSGVYYESQLGSQSFSVDLQESIRRKDIRGNSFAFIVPEGKEKWTEQGDEIKRDVFEIRLFEVGPQVFPAYSQTNLKLRSIFGVDDDLFDARTLAKAQFFALKGLTLPESDVDNLRSQFRTLLEVLPNKETENIRFLTGCIEAYSRGREFSDNDREAFNAHIALVRSILSDGTEPDAAGDHSNVENEPNESDHSYRWLQDKARMTASIMELVI